MPETIVIVQRSGGGYVKGAKVSLGFSISDHPLSAGLTKSSYTDHRGEATIHHSNTGRATVYVNGREAVEVYAPDKVFVYI